MNDSSQSPDRRLTWIDAASLPIEGRGWRDVKTPYDRLPLRAESVVREPVWRFSLDTAGLLYRLSTDTPELMVRWKLRQEKIAMTHMPASGVSGFDLYAQDVGRWRWMAAVRAETFPDNTAVLFENLSRQRRELLLYLPLYNGIASLELGIAAESGLEAASRSDRPIVFYGTSIVQGGCVSRPGLAYPAILGRKLDRPVINLGFSGNGKAEPEMAALLAELDPVMYVVDCLPNLGPEEAHKLEPFLTTLRQAHPRTPIVCIENVEYTNSWAVPARRNQHQGATRVLREIYSRLAPTDSRLHLIAGGGLIGDDGEATMDGVHPSDLGATRMAGMLEPELRRILAAADH